MSPDTLFIISILVVSVAAGWSVVVALRLRDWRVLFLTALLLAIALVQSLHLVSGSELAHGLPIEIASLVASFLSLVLVSVIESVVVGARSTANQLQDSQDRYRSLVEDNVDLVCQFKPDGTLTFVNRAYADYFGRTVEELVGTSFVDLIPEEERPAIREYLSSFGRDKDKAIIVHEAILPDGSRRWQEWTDHAFVDDTGTVTGMQSIGRDITDRKQAEDALRQSEELNRRIIEVFPGGVITIDRGGQVVRANEEGLKMLGVTEEQLPEINITNLEPWTVFENGVTCPTDEFPATKCLRSGEKQDPIILGTLRPSGEISWAVFTAVPLSDHSSEGLEGAVLTFLDITDRKVAEEALRDSEANQRAVVQAVPDAMFRLTKEGVFRDFIPGETVETLMDPKQFLGRTIQEVMPKGIAARTMRAIRDALRSNDRQEFEYELEVDGTLRHYEARLVPDRAESVLGLVRDITDRRVAELQREDLLVELEAKNRELERFARTVSHDLKSPLITIRGFMEVLEDDRANVSDRAVQAIDRINNAAKMMLHLLDDLLELARVGRLVNPLEELAFGEIVRAAVDQVAGRIVKHGVKVKIDADLPYVAADRTRLVQVVQNLLDNAVKFMGDQRNPRIEIGASERDGRVLCWVRDNGEGIDSRNLERIFGVFDRLQHHVEGSGIGLALARRIIDVHGGEIWAESDGVGKGTTIYFTLPANVSPERSENITAA